ncbi:cutinase family protein [Mycolicibacterium sp. CBMA 226]|uniref:cutinase family protein n=1 Tax=Mycolicibacterium sp. CBMA 226 TaxID=2606611 RepID=UPI0012DD291D|nr:cutinase family protein [Mycolicibacterium sp. CBMA 226]MUL77296.1 cutinase family protein [Mycolicibacterium sp. CBMA 226]
MARVTLLSTSVRVAAIAAAVISGTALLPSAPAKADPCPNIEVIFARGTHDDPGMGRVGSVLVDALQPLVGGRTVTGYAVDYPASYDFLTAQDGATDAQNRIATMAQQCPSTKIVLGGYSQGAAVVDMLAGVPPLGDRIGDVGSAPPLPPELANRVAAAAVFGNPSAKFSHPLDSMGLFANRSVDLCLWGDPICSRGRNPFAHSHYESSDFIGQAAQFIASRV